MILGTKFQATVDNAIDRAVEIVDYGTSYPGRLRKEADKLTDFFIRKGKELEQRAGGKAKANLTASKAESLAGNFTKWVMSGNNKWLAIGAGVLSVFLIVRGFK